MSRVPTKVQFKRYQQLRDIYLTQAEAFGRLDTRDQWVIHRFYQPEKEHSAASLVEAQRIATAEDVALPHRAGKAYKTLMHVASVLAQTKAAPRPATPTRQKGSLRHRRIIVHGVVHPEPDVHKLARLLIELAQLEIERRRDDKGDDGTDQRS